MNALLFSMVVLTVCICDSLPALADDSSASTRTTSSTGNAASTNKAGTKQIGHGQKNSKGTKVNSAVGSKKSRVSGSKSAPNVVTSTDADEKERLSEPYDGATAPKKKGIHPVSSNAH